MKLFDGFLRLLLLFWVVLIWFLWNGCWVFLLVVLMSRSRAGSCRLMVSISRFVMSWFDGFGWMICFWCVGAVCTARFLMFF